MAKTEILTITLNEIKEVLKAIVAQNFGGAAITIIADEGLLTVRDNEGFKIAQLGRDEAPENL